MQRKGNAVGMKMFNLILAVVVALTMVCASIVKAAVTVLPADDQYFEMRAKDINDIEGKNKQLIVELWANKLDFKGFDVRFQYDTTKFNPSNINTNDATTDETEFFKFESEFTDKIDMFTLDEGTAGTMRAIFSLNTPVTESTHIMNDPITGYAVTSTAGEDTSVLIGKFSFEMLVDEFDISGFSLVESESASPKTGIKINVDGNDAYEAQSTFRFADNTASKDSSLSKLEVSRMEDDEESGEQVEKQYTLTPTFHSATLTYSLEILEKIDTLDILAKPTDEVSTMKIKVPKRDDDDNLVYEADESTIVYEEKELTSDTKEPVTLNKLGEPDTKIEIVVTAEDTNFTTTYTIIIHRPYGTIMGSIQLGDGLRESMEDNYGVYVEYLANAILYKSDEFDWDGIIDQSTCYEELDLIEQEANVKSDKDTGQYIIYVIPGNYDLQLSKAGFLDNIIKNINVNEGDVIDIPNKILKTGDVEKDGIVSLQDCTQMLNLMDSSAGDGVYDETYDFGKKGYIALVDITTLLGEMDSLMTVEEY